MTGIIARVVRPLLRKPLAEALSTFVLVFAGTGAIVINDVSGGAVTHLGIALVFGLVVMAMIYSLGDVSGAHMNPAVTVAFAVTRRIGWGTVPGYVAAQLVGGLAASLTLGLLFPEHGTLGLTAPAGGIGQSFVLEVILTAILMFVVLQVSTGSKEVAALGGLVIGATVGLEALFAGPISGASMNPARSFGPAVAAGRLEHLWLYMVATPLGAILGGGCWWLLRDATGAGAKAEREHELKPLRALDGHGPRRTVGAGSGSSQGQDAEGGPRRDPRRSSMSDR